MKFAFIAAEKATFPVSLLCRTLGVSRPGFYASQAPRRRRGTEPTSGWASRSRRSTPRADDGMGARASTPSSAPAAAARVASAWRG